MFVGIGLKALGEKPAIGWLCTIFFGFGVVVFVVQLFPGASYLRITKEGFQFCALFRKSPLFLWRDVSTFRVARLPPAGSRMVVFDWSAKPERGVRSFNRAVAGATDGLPDNFGMKHQALADLLNEWRSRATGLSIQWMR